MPSVPQLSPEIVEFYSQTVDESSRLTRSADGLLELVRTQEILRSHLPPAPATVLDVGGGPGIHSRWLIEAGYTVHVVDPIPRHVEQAAKAGASSELGDARKLSADTGSFDVVLLLGPLYHLLDRTERDQALTEAVRVVKPGALVAAAAIGRYASLFEHVATTLLDKEHVRDAVQDILATGIHEPGRKGFTAAYFHTPDGLVEEMTTAGLEGVTIHSVEGPSWGALKATEEHTRESMQNSPMFQAALHAARLADSYPELLAASSHMLAVGKTPS
ncbi:class I SAM-dependent methyltransferase [Streptomyces endophyticus]|uniref:Class I SAM-dependent methyltransferase n=1 Tax=Streptomyces endophyticus TaxID=714166 RepID=A0ABU6F225_9ACTN|nr:class I SAM-dependent methyltransferase [Streptomyces endophyticus]MEB8338039.1 class I SAM-dependent methyltransferase [Streptomyces endophyticus]